MKHDLAYKHRFDHVNLTLMPGDESRRNWEIDYGIGLRVWKNKSEK